jgi:pimeloyl-ACP methyl ester carboxylesterase
VHPRSIHRSQSAHLLRIQGTAPVYSQALWRPTGEHCDRPLNALANQAIIRLFAPTPGRFLVCEKSMSMSRQSLLGLSKAGFHRVSYCEWGDPAAQRLVICVHGLTRNARDFDMLARTLSTHCRVVCPDLVGRGQSEWLADKSDYAYPQYLADMTALIARASASLPAGDAIDWVGTSIGGLIGMLLAAQPGTPIRRLVLNDVGPLLPKAALSRIASYVGKAPEFESFDAAERYIRDVSAPFGPLTDPQWHHLAEHSVGRTPSGSWRLNYDPGIAQTFKDLPQTDISLWPVWDRITCPVLVLRGSASDLLSIDTADAMTRRGPKARVVEFPGVGHAPALMAAEQLAAVREFLLEASLSHEQVPPGTR